MAQRRTMTLTNQQYNQLIDYRNHDQRPYVRERCAALIKIAQGKSPHWVATQGLLKERDPDTAYNWLHLYQSQGIDGLIAHQHGGSRRRCL